MHLASVICFALRSLALLWAFGSMGQTTQNLKAGTTKITEDTKGKTKARNNYKGLFCKYFFVLFVSFVVKILFGCPLHAGGAPISEYLGQPENSA